MKKIKNIFYRKQGKGKYTNVSFSFPVKDSKISRSVLSYLILIIKKYFILNEEHQNYICMVYITNNQEVLTLGQATLWSKSSNGKILTDVILKRVNERIFQIYRWKKIDYIIFNFTKWAL